MTQTAATHCCQCTVDAGDTCTHLVGRLLCRPHGQTEIPYADRPVVSEHPPVVPTAEVLEQIDPAPATTWGVPPCARCGKPLEEPGGLLFGAPDPYSNVVQSHLCVVCVEVIVEEWFA